MKLKECIEIGKECGLFSIGECYNNIVLHRLSLFKYDDISREIKELQKDIFYNHPDLFCDIFSTKKEDLLAKGWRIKDEKIKSMRK